MGQRHDPAAFYSQEKNGTHCTEGCVGLRADGNRCENLAPTRIRYLYRPKSSQSLYRLSYPAQIKYKLLINLHEEQRSVGCLSGISEFMYCNIYKSYIDLLQCQLIILSVTD